MHADIAAPPLTVLRSSGPGSDPVRFRELAKSADTDPAVRVQLDARAGGVLVLFRAASPGYWDTPGALDAAMAAHVRALANGPDGKDIYGPWAPGDLRDADGEGDAGR